MANHHSTFSDFSYDVFLGFSLGTSESNAFVDRLYEALLRKKVNTFRNEAKLRTGEGEIRASIEEIENSKMAMLVICENFASSVASLDELLKISEYIDNKRKLVTVVFYIVEPGDVRKQKNNFKVAMAEYEEKYGKESEKVKAWRNALTRVCDLRGEHYKGDVDESEFIERIAQDTFTKIAPVPVKTSHVVGIDSHFERLKSFIDVESDDTTVRMLGIYGAGGIGKTTLAACLYNKIMHCFDAKSFLFNVREESNKNNNGLEDLQKTLLSKMGEETKTMTGSTLQRSIEIKRRLGHRKVLLVLDDVDKIEQLKLLAGGYDWFGSGSRIIITTRDVAVLDNHVKMEKYKVEELDDCDSLELFCWNAFDMREPAKDFEIISSRAVSYAKGIPLALQVIGSNLKGRSIEDWETELGKYRNNPDAKIQDVLEVSYNSLSGSEKRIFLDIACFFRGEKWAYVKRILEACDLFPSSTVFDNKCLITLDENGCLEMHDLIQDMGREIVRKESESDPGKRSRLWSHKDVLQVLKGNSGSITVEGIMLHPPRHENIDEWANSAFENMKNLRILIVRNTTFSTGPGYLPNNLRLLDWMEFPSKSFPSNFYPERMVDLKLSHSPLILTKLLQKFEDLTFINVSQCQSITQIPSLFGARNLRVLTLDRCHKLEGFDKSIGFMPKLAYLSASECTMLRSFVPEMYLPSLEVLSFNFCTGLEHFPNVTRKMSKPLKIHMMNTAINNFPVSISNLIGLEFIDVSGCKGLKDLPRCIKESSYLKSLDVGYCENLTKLPELPLSIQKIDARYCKSLTSEAVNMLWTQVYEEKGRIQVVMPTTKIPDWFDCVSNEGIPHFWAHEKFPVVALAFVFGDVIDNDEIKMDTSKFIPRMESNKSHVVGLHLFIDDQEICHKDYHHFNVGEHHVLLCDLRAMFDDQEWQSLDSHFVGNDWKAIQIQCESELVLSHWGIHIYKHKRNIDDTQFSLSNPNPSRDFCISPSSLVPKTIPHAQSSDKIEIFTHYLNRLNSEQTASVANLLLRWWRNNESNTRGKASAHYGASLMQECEDDVWDVAQILEVLMEDVTKHVTDSEFQNAGRLVVELLTTRVHVKENGHEKLHINMNMPIILEECECHHHSHDLEGGPRHRYFGTVELEEGDPLVWRIWKSKEAFLEREKVVLLRCESCQYFSTDEVSSSGIREEYNNPALLELMRRREDDAMRLNKSCRKLKASIIPMDEVLVSDKYMMETAIIRGQERLGKLGSKFKKIPHGMLREEHDTKILNQHEFGVKHGAENQDLREFGVEHDAENQNQCEFKVEHHAENQRTTQNKNKLGWTKFLFGGLNKLEGAFGRRKG